MGKILSRIFGPVWRIQYNELYRFYKNTVLVIYMCIQSLQLAGHLTRMLVRGM